MAVLKLAAKYRRTCESARSAVITGCLLNRPPANNLGGFFHPHQYLTEYPTRDLVLPLSAHIGQWLGTMNDRLPLG